MASYDELAKIVVNVEVYNEREGMFDCEGAGVFVSQVGHVLTLSHMFNDDPNAQVRIVNKDGDIYACSIVDVTPNLGLALLKVNKNEKFPCATVHEGELDNGKRVYCVGLPYYLDYSYPIGEISYPCRLYGEILDYIKEAQDFKWRNKLTNVDRDPSAIHVNDVDPSAVHLNYVDDLKVLKLERWVPLVQLNNVHGGGLGGSSGMSVFNSIQHIIGMYAFTAHDKCYAIHARCIRSYLNYCSQIVPEHL